MKCLDEYVGITKTDCPCFTDGLNPETITSLRASKSGLYVDALPGVPSLKTLTGAFRCSEFAKITIEARDNAIRTTRDDMILGISNRTERTRDTFTGNLGHMSFSSPFTPMRPVVGMQISPATTGSDAVMKLTQISIITFTALSTTVKLYKAPSGATMGTEIGSWAVTTIPQAYTPVSAFSAQDLPLYEGGQPVYYFIMYDTHGALPMDIKPSCNCQGTEANMRKFISISGFSSYALNELPGVAEQYTGGIVASVQIGCPAEQYVCRQHDENNAVSITLGYSIQALTAHNIVDALLKRPDINNFTMIQREHLYGQRAHFLKEYQTRMQYLPTVVNPQASDCWICKELVSNEPTRVTIPL